MPTSRAVAAADSIEARTIRKVTRRIIPFVAVLYFVNYLDRTNVGFAKLTMSADLGLTETMFGLASGLFFIGYLLFEVPSNVALHRFGARIWMARIMVTWGIVAALMAFVQNASQLYVLRVLLGIAEAGFFPGIILYLTFWFPRAVRARLVALFMVAIPVSSTLGAPLSTAIMQYADGLFGLAGWRLMFLAEAVPAIGLGVVCFFCLTDRPAQAKWLSDDERNWLTSSLDAESREVAARQGHTNHWRVLMDRRIVALGLVYFGLTYGSYALGFYMPTIVAGFSKQFGTTFSLLESGLIVAIPFGLASIAMVLWGRRSDRLRERFWHTALPAIIGGITVPIALYLNSPFLVIVAVAITACGVYCALPVFWYLPASLVTGASAAVGLAAINSIGNSSGFIAPYLTGALADATGGYHLSMWAVGGAMLLGAIGVLVLKRQAPSAGWRDDVDEQHTPQASNAAS
ncbi:MFS family permease [Mycolicibacterium sp. BK556]|uniref:MFS transporter n=1 Tax=unclassified Mycolicibacterium TaxID=2636767 RepID=UPI0010436622|nr:MULTISPECIES: MFS transporter [unclassified Mycolicibacterium]MBB3607089.1 MFS family permease [Mycolicibacterium sp. BK556]MBB3636801.1 MFS family permease [Mycolicibacterium sp. BK607]